MKRTIYFLMICLMAGLLPVAAQNDTIVGWDFSDSSDVSFNANMGLSGNLGYDIRAEDSTGMVRTLFYAVHTPDYAAYTDGWDGGADNKFWSVKFKAAGFTSMKLYSKQYSDSQNPGPKYWKIQVRKSGGAWTDVVNGDVTVMEDWTTGVVDALDLPAILDNPGSTSIYIRWMMVSDESTSGSPVLPTGVSMIDDIMVTGVNSVGMETLVYGHDIEIYPNPASNVMNISTPDPIQQVLMYDISGALIYSETPGSTFHTMDVSHLPNGSYVVKMELADDQAPIVEKVLIRR